MKRRLLYLILAIAMVLVLVRTLKGPAIAWYAENVYVRTTAYPASATPDEICLTVTADPKTSMAIQWRSDKTATEGSVQYREKGQGEADTEEVPARMTVVEDRLLENDPVNHRFSAVLPGLRPGTAYAYRVGSKSADTWSAWAEFTTAPAEATPFSFAYLGDPQVGLDYWGKLIHRADENHPAAAFYAIAGDLVNNGGWRDQWDQFFEAGKGLFDRKPLAPALGNHDYSRQEVPKLYLDMFTLPENGPRDFPPERAYSFEYGNALVLVLDSNQSPAEQAAWLEDRLAHTKATWKFALYHHPAYSSKASRDNPDVRVVWGAIFDKYHVDMALQGHDHAYLRTYPMLDGHRVDSPAEGTIYVVSDSGTKYYEQDPRDYTAVGFTDVSTYQVLDITTHPDKLTYRAYDFDGKVRDEVVIEK